LWLAPDFAPASYFSAASRDGSAPLTRVADSLSGERLLKKPMAGSGTRFVIVV
jgi:hypothetical protein